jgi:outer membrane protein assembly factor BamB
VELPYGVGRGHPYAMMAVDGRRTARSAGRVPAVAPRELWTLRLGQRRLLPPVVLSDGTLVVGSAGGLTALARDGLRLWHVELGQVRFTPTLMPSGELLVATYEGKLWVVSMDGKAHALESAAALSGQPLVLDGGSIVVGARDSQVHVLDQEGTELLRVPTGAREPFWSARVGGGLLAVAGPERELALFSLHAGLERRVPLPERVSLGLVVDDEGGIHFVGDQGTLFRIGSGGRIEATQPLDERAVTAPVLGRDGALRIGLASRELLCVGRDGKQRWRRGIDGRPSALLLDADDTTLVMSVRGTLYAIDAAGELRWRLGSGVHRGARPVLAADGTIYLVGRDGLMKAVR